MRRILAQAGWWVALDRAVRRALGTGLGAGLDRSEGAAAAAPRRRRRLPQQAQYFDIAGDRRRGGERRRPYAWSRHVDRDGHCGCSLALASALRWRCRSASDPLLPPVRQAGAAERDPARADVSFRLAACRDLPLRHRRRAGDLSGVPRRLLHHRAGDDREIDASSPTYLNVARTMGATRAQTYRLRSSCRPSAWPVHDPAAQPVRRMDDRAGRRVGRVGSGLGAGDHARAQHFQLPTS